MKGQASSCGSRFEPSFRAEVTAQRRAVFPQAPRGAGPWLLDSRAYVLIGLVCFPLPPLPPALLLGFSSSEGSLPFPRTTRADEPLCSVCLALHSKARCLEVSKCFCKGTAALQKLPFLVPAPLPASDTDAPLCPERPASHSPTALLGVRVADSS